MKVSVALVTYNDELFIAQAIVSVLSQKTRFDVELIVGEDSSTDRTSEIVLSYQERFPGKIRILPNEKHLGIHRNLARTLAACTGQYVAPLEGDDYWTSPHKLQKQADFLDSKLDCAICFHPVNWFYEDGHIGDGRPEQDTEWPRSHRGSSTIEDLLGEMFIPTGSAMFRNGLVGEYPEWLDELKMADWPLYVLIADHGKIGCLDEVMSAYRNHAGGVWFALEDEMRYREVIKMYELLDAHFGYIYANVIRPLLARSHLKLSDLYDETGTRDRALPAVARSVAVGLGSGNMPALSLLKVLAELSLPSVYKLSRRVRKAFAH
jgi:glycosyltransferase involved in cell wall biosynthesis